MMAETLSMMKQQMMENETGYGMEKKFGCVKVGTLRSTPCTVSSTFFLNCIVYRCNT